MSSLRIIGGNWRGRKISFYDRADVRPSPSRVRETLFNWLGQVIDHKTCLDLFSGTGSLGLESISRGAHKVTFVEKNFEHFDKLKGYIEKLNATEEISIINNVCKFLSVNVMKPSLIKVKNVTIPMKIHKNEDKIIQLKFFIILNI